MAGPLGMRAITSVSGNGSSLNRSLGGMKTVGGMRKLRHRGVALVDWQLTFAATTYNLVRLRNLEATCP